MTANLREITLQLYSVVASLPRHRFPVPRGAVPANGIYLIYEQGEFVEVEEGSIDRIVRVGTHTGDKGLARRLRRHVSGKRRTSVFRTHLGAALLKRDDPDDARLEPWINERETRMPDVESSVSEVVQTSFSVACVPVPDQVERLALERGLIALLAASPLAQPSPNWLGFHSYHPTVRQSGLWNTQHVGADPLTAVELARLHELLSNSAD